jgi:formamidopyrimidine-DNA glycosylase
VPELPEIETITRDLDREIRGATITGVHVTRPNVLREVGARALGRRVRGQRITRCWRRAKLAVIDLSSTDRLVVQPRFTGALLIDRGDLAEQERRYSTVRFDLDDGRTLHYRDVRRLGTVTLMAPARFDAYTGALGIEPLDGGWTTQQLSARLRTSRQAIKKVLMDQRVVGGIGNIYANEALWRARIDPSRPARSLTEAETELLRDASVSVLTEAIAARGTSFRDYRDAAGGRGEFSLQLEAYGRAGEPCRRCGQRLVGTHAIDGRQTVLCAQCQH